MQFFASSQNAARTATPAFLAAARKMAVAAAPARSAAPARASDAGPCGWFDSTLDLRGGLEVSEQDSDTLYQLWALATH